MRIISALAGILVLLFSLYLGKVFLWAISIIFTVCVIEYISLLSVKKKLNPLYLFGFAYLALIFTLNASRQLPLGQILVLFTLLGTWGFDTAAYFVGSRWGEYRVLPKISPNKSLEGFLAGLFVVALVGIMLPDFLFTKGLASLLKTVWILAIAIGAFFGDLIESLFKRQLEIKDSSRLIPGHGGFLDRFDSLILTSTFSYLIYRWLM